MVRCDLVKLVSRIFPENDASRALCRALGFREVGVYEKHGQLDGVWKDCVIVERHLLNVGGSGAAPRDAPHRSPAAGPPVRRLRRPSRRSRRR